jgi:MOSC domain-containing protein
MSARLQRITIFPIKSLDGVSVDESDILPSGGLANDRRFALIDAEGRFVSGKRTAAVHRIRASYDLPALLVRLHDTARNVQATFSLAESKSEIGAWLSDALGVACVFSENATGGFPDDTDAPGPTLVSAATLCEVASWFPPLSLGETRRRFRANLEIDGVEPFWEDQLVGGAGREVPFQIGDVEWLGVNPCQRCVVPTRASETGEAMPMFQKVFATRRQESLPTWSPADRFDHFYRLSVNTRLAPNHLGGRLRIGDLLLCP